jgi:hypothetical protein
VAYHLSFSEGNRFFSRTNKTSCRDDRSRPRAWGVNSLLPDFPEETWIKKCWKVLSYIFCADVGDS